MKELADEKRTDAENVEEYGMIDSGFVMIIVKDEDGNIIDTMKTPNTITYSADLLAAELIAGYSVPGITHLAVGTGSPDWDINNPPAPSKEQTQLVNEIARVPVTATFIDPETGNPKAPQSDLDSDGVNQQRTYLVDFKATLSGLQANAGLMEMALFGGAAADLNNKGTMINYYTFKQWIKSEGTSIDIIWRISTRHTAYRVDFGTCAVACQEACELYCQSGCQVTCQEACELTCQIGCISTCEGSCQVGCELTCETACVTGCEVGCQDTCELSTQSTCDIACQDACELSCQAACEVSCQDACITSCETSCQDTCELSCQDACITSCEVSCEEVCQTSCQAACELVCQTSCEAECQTACVTGCETSCQGTCELAAQGDCTTACETTCQGSCQLSCQLGCETTCQLACELAVQ